ncbi:MAG: LysE family transporter [Acidobacteria bacterium]|nr:LysE family transporter [Acidobacteriota bacterium]
MLEFVVLGVGFAFPAAVQPGPLQAFLFTRVTAVGWKPTLPAAFAPVLSDIPIALLVLLALGRLPGTALQVLRATGGLLLIYLAVRTYRALRNPAATPSAADRTIPRTAFEAVLVNLFNPNPYLGWALVLGPAVARAWRHHPGAAVALVAAFYGTMVTTLAATIVLFGSTRRLGAGVQRRLQAWSALGLGALGAYQLGAVVRAVLGPGAGP